MIDSPKEKAEKARAIRKLMSKWLKMQETKGKADLLLAKNPEIMMMRGVYGKKA